MLRGLALVAIVLCTCACGSAKPKPTGPPKVVNFELRSKLMGRDMSDVLVTPSGGTEGRWLLVFLHGYGAAPSDMVDPAFLKALRQPWGSYVLREAIPAVLKRTGAGPHHVAIGGSGSGRPTTRRSGSTSATRTSFARPRQNSPTS